MRLRALIASWQALKGEGEGEGEGGIWAHALNSLLIPFRTPATQARALIVSLDYLWLNS